MAEIHIHVPMNGTVQVTGLFLNWISASDRNPVNFLTSSLKGQPALFRWEAVCSERGGHGFAASQVGMQSRAMDVVLSSRVTYIKSYFLSHLYLMLCFWLSCNTCAYLCLRALSF